MLRRLARDRRWHLRIAVTPDKARRHGLHSRRGVEAVGQGGGDLGVRMRRALAACPPGPVVLVGGDIPALAARHVADAFRLLGRYDLVFGPAEDGGFWLVGARHARHLDQARQACGIALDENDRDAIARVQSASTGPKGDVYDLERVKGGPHASIMRYTLAKHPQ